MMESSVKSISRPVIDRLPVTSLDEFACRQLDRVRAISPSLYLLLFFVTFVLVCHFWAHSFKGYPSSSPHSSRFSSGATAPVRDDRQALTRMSAARASNVNENGDVAVATRVYKYVT